MRLSTWHSLVDRSPEVLDLNRKEQVVHASPQAIPIPIQRGTMDPHGLPDED